MEICLPWWCCSHDVKRPFDMAVAVSCCM
jgi:hypothetical protein